MDELILSLDPFLARKVEVVARERGLTFEDALFFLLQRVITPEAETDADAA